MFVSHRILTETFCFTATLFCFLLPLVYCDDSPHWSYRAQNEWPKQCSGERQSPIDIETKIVSVNKTLNIDRKNYDLSFSNFNVENNGHTVKVEISFTPDQNKPYITGTALDSQVYIFAQLHFHWSDEKGRGSEHAINGKLHSMEMHLVHYNQKYGNFSNASSKYDGLAVIGVLFDITRKGNMHLEPIIEGVKEVKIESSNFFRNDNTRKAIILDDLLPDNVDLFFRYKGSLTTPPCYESVTWLLYSDTNDIGFKQIEFFRGLMSNRKVPLSDTFRYLQSTRDRKIEASQDVPYHVKDGKGIGAQLHSNLFVIQLSLTTSLIMLGKIYI